MPGLADNFHPSFAAEAGAPSGVAAPLTADDVLETLERSRLNERAFERHSIARPASAWLVEWHQSAEEGRKSILVSPRPASVENLSLSGLYLVSTGSYPVGAIVGIHMRLGSTPVRVQTLVCRQTAVQISGKRHYGCGVQFLRTDETRQAILEIIKYFRYDQKKVCSRG